MGGLSTHTEIVDFEPIPKVPSVQVHNMVVD